MNTPTLLQDNWIDLKNEIKSTIISGNGISLVQKYGRHFNNNTSFSLFIARFFFDMDFDDLRNTMKMEGLKIGESLVYSIPEHLNVTFTLEADDSIRATLGVFAEDISGIEKHIEYTVNSVMMNSSTTINEKHLIVTFDHLVKKLYSIFGEHEILFKMQYDMDVYDNSIPASNDNWGNIKNEIKTLINHKYDEIKDKYGKYFNSKVYFSLFIARFFFDDSFAEIRKNIDEDNETSYCIPNLFSLRFELINENYIHARLIVETDNGGTRIQHAYIHKLLNGVVAFDTISNGFNGVKHVNK